MNLDDLLNLKKIDAMIRANKGIIALLKGKITLVEYEKIADESMLRMQLENIKMEKKHATPR